MSLYKPTQDEIEKYSGELSDLLIGKTKKQIPNEIDITIYDYNKLEIETNLEYLNENNAKRYTHKDSLERLRKNGYQNHLPIQLQMKILMDKLEGSLPKELESVVNEIKWGSWAKELIEYTGDYLIIYENNNGLIWNNDFRAYVPNPHDPKNLPKHHKFDLKEKNTLIMSKISSISQKAPDLIERLFSRPFYKLPVTIRENSTIELPLKNNLINSNTAKYPIKVGSMINNYSIDLSQYGISRGYKKII